MHRYSDALCSNATESALDREVSAWFVYGGKLSPIHCSKDHPQKNAEDDSDDDEGEIVDDNDDEERK